MGNNSAKLSAPTVSASFGGRHFVGIRYGHCGLFAERIQVSGEKITGSCKTVLSPDPQLVDVSSASNKLKCSFKEIKCHNPGTMSFWPPPQDFGFVSKSARLVFWILSPSLIPGHHADLRVRSQNYQPKTDPNIVWADINGGEGKL